MVILIKARIIEFVGKYPASAESLNKWWEITSKVNWNNFNEIKKDFSSADYVGNDRYVFNISGNKFRLIAMIHFSIRTVYIRGILTHKEYDNTDCSTL